MAKQSTSFRLTSSTLTLLKQLAETENRSLTNMVETLIIERAKGSQIVEKLLVWIADNHWAEDGTGAHVVPYTELLAILKGIEK